MDRLVGDSSRTYKCAETAKPNLTALREMNNDAVINRGNACLIIYSVQ